MNVKSSRSYESYEKETTVVTEIGAREPELVKKVKIPRSEETKDCGTIHTIDDSGNMK